MPSAARLIHQEAMHAPAKVCVCKRRTLDYEHIVSFRFLNIYYIDNRQTQKEKKKKIRMKKRERKRKRKRKKKL